MSPAAGPPRRLDASMSLLVEVMERPLDPGYAAAAEQRASGRRPGRVVVVVTLVVAAVCGLIVTRSVAELRRPPASVIEARRQLEREIERRTEQADALQRTTGSLRAEISRQQAAVLTDSGQAGLADQIQLLGTVAGELPVTGPGLQITVDDAPGVAASAGTDPRQGGTVDQGRVYDRDLQIIVNGLWAAGAEAIAINKQRLSPLAAIRGAGQAILVDYRPLVPPYVVQAIGDPAALQSGFARSAAGPYLQGLRDNFGVQAAFSVEQKLDLPAARPVDLRNARPVVPSATPSPLPSARPSSARPSTPAASSSAPRPEVSP